MSLKAFHLFFIALSVVLAAFVAAWAVGQYRAEREAGYIAASAASLVSAAALTVYATQFRRKTKRM